jgi:hypothetical protein
VGVRSAAILLATIVLAGVQAQESGATLRAGVEYLKARQLGGGAFAESGGKADPGLSAWAVLGLRAARAWPDEPGDAAGYLAGRTDAAVTDLELRLLALAALDRNVDTLANRLLGHRRGGRIGPTVNSTIWGMLALRAAGRKVPRACVRYLKRRQAASGGWSWYAGGAPDSNDTAAAVQALRAAGVAPSARIVRRGLGFVRRLQNRDGGFELTPGRGSDAPSTAWAIQAFVSAKQAPGKKAFRYLRGLQRGDGSFRYSRQYVSAPLWTTAQVVAALARRPFPLP